MSETMRAAVFRGNRDIHIEEVPKPVCGPTDAIVRITTTTICGTDVHIWKEEFPVANGRIVGHEPVGVIDQLGEAVTGYSVGDSVVVGAITPCGSCYFCLHGDHSQCAGYEEQWGLIGGWRFGNSMDGTQADYVRVPYAMANLAKIPEGLSDEEVVFVTDIASTGISAAETANVTIGDSVVVDAQGPIGLSATAGARLKGAALVIAVDSNPTRLEMAKKMGADVTINFTEEDPVAKVKALTDGRGADVAIEDLGLQETFENCLRSVRPAGVVSSLGVYGDKITVPLEPFVYGIGDIDIRSTLCPGGKERMRSLMSMVASGRLNLAQLVTHRYTLDQIEEAYPLFANQEDGVLKVAITTG
ncbi:MAG TPA: alcohol dehydrogenase catalytic domain-containing protein [Miltoncostaeaceae bacterium]|nr:alcohol dehydrogenase catalytic domain-containing protein [Miltoncostaeaceae bacterium]